MPDIIFDKNFPEILQPSVQKLFDEFAWLAPLWLQRVYVGYDGNDANNSATVSVNQDYRYVRLTLCAHFISNQNEIMRDDFIHELVHCFISPLKNYAADIVEKLCADNKPLLEIIQDELVARNEAITQDFSYAIANKFKQNA